MEQISIERKLKFPEGFSISDKLILAPMVRICTTPFRILALNHCADIVFTEEIIAKKLLTCEKVYNPELNCNEYISLKDGCLVLRVMPQEKDKLILQIGASNPEDAVKATLVAKDDIIGVDINMGCPKHFSTHGNMGSALLQLPDIARSVCYLIVIILILEGLVNSSLGISLSCKIRLLPDFEKTKEFIQTIQSTGITFFTVHLRIKDQTAKVKANWSALPEVNKASKIPFVVNGDILTPHDILVLSRSGLCQGFMIGRGAIHNPKIFEEYRNLSSDDIFQVDDSDRIFNDTELNNEDTEEKVVKSKNSEEDLRVSTKLTKALEKKYNNRTIDIIPIVQEYTQIALKVGNNFGNSKYNILYILKTHKKHIELFKKIQQSKDYAELCTLLDIKEIYEKSGENMKGYYDGSYYRDRFNQLKK